MIRSSGSRRFSGVWDFRVSSWTALLRRPSKGYEWMGTAGLSFEAQYRGLGLERGHVAVRSSAVGQRVVTHHLTEVVSSKPVSVIARRVLKRDELHAIGEQKRKVV